MERGRLNQYNTVSKQTSLVNNGGTAMLVAWNEAS
jgi:hypothetical protein